MNHAILDAGSYPGNAQSSHGHTCPRCDEPVAKIHRHWPDRLLSIVHSVRRYRCRSQTCAWQGLIAQPRDSASPWTGVARWAVAWIIAGVAATLLVVLLVRTLWDPQRADTTAAGGLRWQAEPIAEVPGESIAGKPLTADDPRHSAGGPLGAPLRGCVWGGPGQHAYGGSLADALAAAQVPGDIVSKLSLMRDAGVVSDRLELSSAGIYSADNKRDFGLTMRALTFDKSICFDAKMNLPSRTVAAANLYEIVDAKQQRYSIMVVANGGNVAVLDGPVGR